MADVIVAGAGPAGATAALLLARAGFEPLIVDRSTFPRTKACGEYLNAGSVRILHELDVASRLTPSVLHGIRLSGNGVRTQLRFSEPGWAVPRIELDDVLLKAALEAGAQLVTGRVEDVKNSPESVSIWVREGDGVRTLQAPLLIGADGLHSIVAKKCGLTAQPHGHQRFALGGHYTGFGGLDGFVEMFVEGSSYFAVNPFDATHANVMLIVGEDDLAARREDVDRFVVQTAERLSGSTLRFSGARLEGKRIAIGPLAHRTKALARGRVLLAGDAAGFVDPFTGQGIYLALRGAAQVAETVPKILQAPAKRVSLLRFYQVQLRREMVQRARLASLVKWVIRSRVLSRRAARNLSRDPSRVTELLDALTGCAEPREAFRLSSLAALIV